jgi:hypothetical protein
LLDLPSYGIFDLYVVTEPLFLFQENAPVSAPLSPEENHMQTSVDDDKLKQLLKEAFIEAIEEKRNVFYELIVDALEDIAMVRAIREGEQSKTVAKQEVFSILEG